MKSPKNDLVSNTVQKSADEPSSFQAKRSSSDDVKTLVSEPWTGYLEVA